MKNVILAISALVALSGAAIAADMPMKAAPVAAAGCAQFGGFYAGVNAGGTRYTAHRNDDDGFFIDNSGHTSTKGGWNAGVQGGYNWQRRCTLWGVEADWSWNSGTAQFSDNPNAPGTIATIDSKMRWFGTARTRGGIIVDDVLLYLTGGFAWANVHDVYSNNTNGAFEQYSLSSTRWGWVGGAGTEWKLTGNWTVKSEVLYMQLNQTRDTIASTVVGPGTRYRFTNNDNAIVARVGLNYLFGGGIR